MRDISVRQFPSLPLKHRSARADEHRVSQTLIISPYDNRVLAKSFEEESLFRDVREKKRDRDVYAMEMKKLGEESVDKTRE